MRASLRWLLIMLVVIIAISCFSGRKRGTGTNIGTGSDDHDGPWSGGTTAAAHER